MNVLFEGLYLLLVVVCLTYLITLQSKSSIGWQLRPVSDSDLPSVSIIIPTLNEEDNIKTCLESLKKLDYPEDKLEIIISDGGSEDATVEIAHKYADVCIVDNNVPEGWVGKSYGCHLGYKESSGEVLLFTDADTLHNPRSLKISVFQLIGSDSTLVSQLPYQKAKKWYEYLIGFYFFLSFFVGGPMNEIINPKNKKAYMAIGQYMLFTRCGYENIGGHIAIKNQILEDIALAKICKQNGHKLYFLEPNKLVSTRMYPDSFFSFYKGFRKVIFEGIFNFPLWRIFFIILWIFYSLVAPYFIVASLLENFAITTEFLFNAGLYLGFPASYFSYWHKRGDGNFLFYILYPLAMALTVFVIVTSIIQGFLGKPIQWKGRLYHDTKIHKEQAEKRKQKREK